MTLGVATPLSWLLLLLAVIISQASSQRDGRTPVPPTPCPAVFRYEYDGSVGRWHGVITIVPPARFSEAQLVVRLDLPYYRPDAGVGHVEIRGGNNQVHRISNKAQRGERQKLEYIVVFPPFKDLPRVAGVTFNGKNFCPQTQTSSTTRGTIELKYTLKTGLLIPIASGTEFSVSPAAQPSQPDFLPEVAEANPSRPHPSRPHPSRPHPGVPTTESSIEVIVVEIPNNEHTDNTNIPLNNRPQILPDSFLFPENNNFPTQRPGMTATIRPTMTSGQVDERIVHLLYSISKGETVATARIESLLERLLALTKKRYSVEVERLRIEQERLKLETG